LKLATVPSKLHEQARTGVESCPEHALAIVETGAAAT
jgi:ferredoxin